MTKEHDMPFKEMQKWYDGYYFEKIGHVYSPNSVIEVIQSREFGNYWSGTETYESLVVYIAMDFANMVFLSKRTSSNPALVLELKWDKTAEGTINQIKSKRYVSALKEYKGNSSLVGINYEKKSINAE